MSLYLQICFLASHQLIILHLECQYNFVSIFASHREHQLDPVQEQKTFERVSIRRHENVFAYFDSSSK